MAELAWILAFLGILCVAMGVVTATEVLSPLYAAFTPEFWLTLATVIMLATIAATLGRGRREEE